MTSTSEMYLYAMPTNGMRRENWWIHGREVAAECNLADTDGSFYGIIYTNTLIRG